MSQNNSDRTNKNNKANKSPRNNIFSQIYRIYKYTHEYDKLLPLLLAIAFIAPIVLCLAIGFALHWQVVTLVMTAITAVMLGFLLFTIVLTKRADKVGYARLEGKPGAAIGILSSINKGGFTFPKEPIWVDPRTKDAIWRGTGHNGIFLIGEGNYERVMTAMNRQEQSIKHITACNSFHSAYCLMLGNWIRFALAGCDFSYDRDYSCDARILTFHYCAYQARR